MLSIWVDLSKVAGQSVSNTGFIYSRTASRKQPELLSYSTLPKKQLQHKCKNTHTHAQTVVAIQKHVKILLKHTKNGQKRYVRNF